MRESLSERLSPATNWQILSFSAGAAASLQTCDRLRSAPSIASLRHECALQP